MPRLFPSPRFVFRLFAAACILVARPGAAGAAPLYSVTPIPVGPFSGLGGVALNDAGHVVGFGGLPGGNGGFYWSPETGTLNLGQGSIAVAVNNHDVVAGSYRPAGGGIRGFTWDPQGRTIAEVPSSTFVTDVNDAGQLAYRVDVGGSPVGSFLRDPDGTVRPLPNPAGTQRAEVGRMGEQGDVVGSAVLTSNGLTRAAYWSPTGEARVLANPTDFYGSAASDINGAGIVVGNGRPGPAADDPHPSRALLWDLAAGTVTDLGTLPGDPEASAYAINDAGEVVGGSGTAPSTVGTHPFLWTRSAGMLDLNTLLDASGRGWTLELTRDINNRGQILTSGYFNGVGHMVILTPVPEPDAAALLLLPAAALGARRARSRSCA